MLPCAVSRRKCLALRSECVRWTRLLTMLAACGALCSAGAQSAGSQTTTKFYRYVVFTDTFDNDFRLEIAAGAIPKGDYYKVERDQQGRIVRETGMRDGKESAVTTYHYSGSSRFYDSDETFVNGEKTQITLYQRDPQGRVTRMDKETAVGKPTQYWVLTWSPSHVDVRIYDPDNRPTDHLSSDFSPGGLQARQVQYSSPASDASYSEIEMDEHTGLDFSEREVRDGKLVNTRKFSYDGNGDKTRIDVYNSEGVWFASVEFTDGKTTRRKYGSGKEVRYSYDNGEVKEGTIMIGGRTLCKLTYDRESDGTLKRTLAIGADGTLWAEYPPPMVWDINQNGQPMGGRTDGIIHKTGNWW